MKIVKFDPEPKLSDDMFRFSPKPGMKVWDRDNDETFVESLLGSSVRTNRQENTANK